MKTNNYEHNSGRKKHTTSNKDSKSNTFKQECLKVCDINKNILNNNKINNNIKNNTLLAETSFCLPSSSKSLESIDSSNPCNHDTCFHDTCLQDSHNGLTFRKNINSHDSHGENGGEANVAKHTPCGAEECANGVGHPIDRVKMYEEEIKKLSERSSNNKEMNDLIEEMKQELERYKAVLKRVEILNERERERERKENERIKWEKRIHSKIDIDYSDNAKLNEKFKLFITNLRELGFKTTYNTYTKYSQQLNKYKTEEEKMEALTIAICWGTPTLEFELNKDPNPRKKRYKNKQKKR